MRKIVIVSPAEDAVCNQMQANTKILLTYTYREIEPFQLYPGCMNELERQEIEEDEKEKKEKQKKEEEEEQEGIGRKVAFFLRQRVMTYRLL